MQKYWISKYALTAGVFEIEAEISSTSPNMICERSKKGHLYDRIFQGEGKEWHKTKEEAINKANEMKNKKLQSLHKQIEKIQKMKFD